MVGSGGGRSRRRFLLAVALSFYPGVVHAQTVPYPASPARPARRRRAPHPGQPVDAAAPAHARRRPGDGSRPPPPGAPAGARLPAAAGHRPQPGGQAAGVHPLGPRPARPAREPPAHLGERAPDRPARDRAALAPPGLPALLAAEIGAALPALPTGDGHD